MNELVLKIDNLIEKIDSWEVASHIKELNSRILEDDYLQELLKEYSISSDENIKKEILSSSLFQEYKEYETEINFFILSFNKKLKELTKKDGCL